MKECYSQTTKKIHAELQSIDFESCDITLDESERMLKFLQKCLSETRDHFLSKEPVSIEEEIGL